MILETDQLIQTKSLKMVNRKKADSWVEYYNERSKDFNTPEEIGCHYYGKELVGEDFLKRESDRLRSLLQPDANESIYDLGCGGGLSLKLVGKYFKTAIGVDMGIETVRKAKEFFPQYTFFQDNIAKLDNFEKGQMKFVLIYGVIYCMGDMDDVITCFNNLARVTKKGARIVICKIPDSEHHDEYQEYRMGVRKQHKTEEKTLANDDLKWIWMSENFIREYTSDHFDLIIIRPFASTLMPFKAWFDCILIRK